MVDSVKIGVVFLLLIIISLLSYVVYTIATKKEGFSNPKPDNNYIDIFNNEEIQLRRGATSGAAVPPTVRQALYADKGMIIPREQNCLCLENEF